MNKVLIDGKSVSVSETKTTVSFKSPSPAWASNLFNIIMGISAIVSTIVLTFPEYIPDKTEDIIMRAIAISLPIARMVTKMFGLELKEK